MVSEAFGDSVPAEPTHIVSNSPLTKEIYYSGKNYNQYMPVINKNYPFWNHCPERTLRRFCIAMLCKKESNGELSIDESRIPEKSLLKGFFTPNFKPSDYANNDDSSTRTKWAEIVDGRENEGIMYSDGHLKGGWINFIKVFCRLMDGYTATGKSGDIGKQKEAEKIIKSVNNGEAFKNSSEITPQS
ncbi:hypothetical protein FACS189449_11960 [Alphaproteobacteria bacterium]|nr:hypothetical protein FACS189449_11960 [Alphaproteobacteria bacterium]